MSRRHQDVLRDLCAHVHEDDGVNPRLERKGSSPSDRAATRKDLQLCKVASRAISHALRLHAYDPLLTDLDVLRVEPAPDGTRLRVWCAPTGPTTPDRLIAAQHRLAALRPHFRAELAAAIQRKRVPELTFAVRPMEVHNEE